MKGKYKLDKKNIYTLIVLMRYYNYKHIPSAHSKPVCKMSNRVLKPFIHTKDSKNTEYLRNDKTITQRQNCPLNSNFFFSFEK